MLWENLKVLYEDYCMSVIYAVPTQSSARLSNWRYLIPALYDHHSCCNNSELWKTMTLVLSHSSAWLSHVLYLLTAVYANQTCCIYSQLWMTVKLAISTHSSVCLSHSQYLLTALYDCHTCSTYSQLCSTVKLAAPTQSSTWLSHLLCLHTALHDYHTCCAYTQFCMTITLAVPTHSSAWLSHLLCLHTARPDYHTCCAYSRALHNHHTCCTYSAAQLIEAPLHIIHYTPMHMPLIEKLNLLYKIHHTCCTYLELCLTFWELLLDTCSSSGWSSSSQYSLHSDACACYRKNQTHFMIRMETNHSLPLLGHDANINIFQAPVTGQRCLCNVP
jgi:hypothetical protein